VLVWTFPQNVLPPSSGQLNLVQMDAEMLGRRKFVVFVVRFPGCWPSRAAERVQEMLHVLSQWKPFSGLRWWELLKLHAEGFSVGDRICRVVNCIHVLMQVYDASQEGETLLFLVNAICLLPSFFKGTDWRLL